MVKLGECGVCCGGFSLFGGLFLLVLYQILHSNSHVINMEEGSKREKAANNALYAAFIYFGFIIVSLGCVAYSKQQERENHVEPTENDPLV